MSTEAATVSSSKRPKSIRSLLYSRTSKREEDRPRSAQRETTSRFSEVQSTPKSLLQRSQRPETAGSRRSN